MAPPNLPHYQKDEKILCFHHELLYEAKVLDYKHIDENDKKSPYEYLVHYKGWKATWDDWVPQDRIRKDTEESRELAANLKQEMTAFLNPHKAKAPSTKKKALGSDVSSLRGSEDRQTPAMSRGQKRGRDNDIEKVGTNLTFSRGLQRKRPRNVQESTRSLRSRGKPAVSPLNIDLSERRATQIKIEEMAKAEKNALMKFQLQEDKYKFPTKFPDSYMRRQCQTMQTENDNSAPDVNRAVRPKLKRKRSTDSLDEYWRNEQAIYVSYVKPLAPKAAFLATLSGKDLTDKKWKERHWIDNDLNNPSTQTPKPVGRTANATNRNKIAKIPLQENPKDPVGHVSKKWACANPVHGPNKKLKGTDVEPLANQEMYNEQEENFNQRPAIHIPVPDHLKSLLVDDWEYVTKNLSLIPLPADHTVNAIVDAYYEDEKAKRRYGSAEADILQEVVSGIKEYFDKTLGKILLYRFERQQYLDMHKKMVSGQDDMENKGVGDVYGAEHLARLIVSLPELIAQTNMDEQSVRKLREEMVKMTAWLGKNSARFFTAEYQPASQEYIEKARGD